MSDFIHNKRSHGIVIFEDTIKGATNFIIPFIIAFLPALRSGKLGGVIVTLAIFMAFFGLNIIYSIAAWFFKTYSIENEVFTLRYGVFVKKSREIPIQKIITFHEMQTLTQRLFKAWTIKLDTGSSMLNQTEVTLVAAQEDLPIIRTLLKPIQNIDGEEATNNNKPSSEVVYRSRTSSLIKMGLTSNALFAGLALILSLFQFFSDFIDNDQLLKYAENTIKSFALKVTLGLFLFVFLALIIYSIVSLLVAAATTLIKYHDFKILKDKDTLVIQYGLLKRNSFSIAERKIHAIYLKQSFLRQILGLATVHIESIGYGNEKGEEALLIPLIKLTEVHSQLSCILSDYRMPAPHERVPKRSLRRFILSALILPLLLIIPISIIYPLGFLSLLFVPFFLVSGVLQYKNSGIAWNDKFLYMGYGGFTRVFAQVKRKGIQSVIKKATPFQRAAGLFTLNISIQGTIFGKVLAVKHLDEALFEDTRKLV